MSAFNPATVFQATAVRPVDPLEVQARVAQLRALQNGNQIDQMRLAELQRQQQQQANIRAAAQGAVGPQQGIYTVPGVGLAMPGATLPDGSQLPDSQVQLPNRTVNTVTPGIKVFDRQKFLQNLMQSDPLAAQGFQAQDAAAHQEQQKQQIALQESLLKLSAGQRAEAQAQLQDSSKGLYAVESLPPEQRQQAYQLELNRQLQAKIIHQNQIGSELPAQYPGSEGMAAIMQRADSVSSILKRIQEEKDGVPLDANTAALLGKKPGAKVPLATLNTATEIASRGNNPDAQSLKAWLAKNPGKDASDYTLWKAKNSPMMIMNSAGGNLTSDGLDMAAQYYAQTGTLPSGFTRDPAITKAVINRAAQLNPNADIAGNKINYEASKGTAKYMTSGKGGQQITAYNTALLHLNTLDRLADDLNNTNINIVNRAKQAWAQQTGDPAPANFAAAVNAMSGEVASALKASGATDQEISKAASTFGNAQSPAQLKGAINTYRELLKGKASQLQRQNDMGRKGLPAFEGSQPSAAPKAGNDWFSQHGGSPIQ